MNTDEEKINSLEKDILEISTLYNISEMAQSVAYEINNPLMIINGYSKKINKNIDNPDYKDFKKDIQAIEKSSERINTIIQNLLEYSRKTLTLPLESVSFVDLVDKSIKLFNDTSGETASVINFDKNMATNINVNSMLCMQAIVNVIRHCIDHCEQESPAKIDLSFRKYKDRIELVLKDNGEKLSDEVQSKMFYQTFSTSSEGEVIGMGMNSSFNIAKKFQGDLYFDNSYSENAFVISFPEA